MRNLKGGDAVGEVDHLHVADDHIVGAFGTAVADADTCPSAVALDGVTAAVEDDAAGLDADARAADGLGSNKIGREFVGTRFGDGCTGVRALRGGSSRVDTDAGED